MADHFDLFGYKPSVAPYLREIEIIIKDHYLKTMRSISVKRPPLDFQTSIPQIRQEAHDKLDTVLDSLGLR